MKALDDKVYALLVTGQIVCARTSPSSNQAIAWAGIAPLMSNTTSRGWRAFSFEAGTSAVQVGETEVKDLLQKRCVTFPDERGDDAILGAAVTTLRSWGVDCARLMQASLDPTFPLWLVMVLIQTKRFERYAPVERTSITDRAYAMLSIGETLGAELAPSSDDFRSWVAVEPCADARFAADKEYRHLQVLMFDMPSSIEGPTYDYDLYMKNIRRAEISSEEGFDCAAEKLEMLLSSWDIEPRWLGPLSRDYPIF